MEQQSHHLELSFRDAPLLQHLSRGKHQTGTKFHVSDK